MKRFIWFLFLLPLFASILVLAEQPPSMVRVPGTVRFPTGVKDSGSCAAVDYPYLMATTEVTYSQWKTVYNWAMEHGYIFVHTGCRGGYLEGGNFGVYNSGKEDHPVTGISWRDCIVWCNALTEYVNAVDGTDFACVYRYNGAVVRDASNETACDMVNVDSDCKGFRLPTNMEWELAARYIDGVKWTPGNCASGAEGFYKNKKLTELVAWYKENSGLSTHPVGTKKPNALGIYDLSGNVWEWCFEWHPKYIGIARVSRGGGWGDKTPDFLQVGDINGFPPSNAGVNVGFRVVRTL